MLRKTAMEFVDAINAHDPQRIVSLMTDDHVFIDTYGTVQLKKEMETGWPGYFDWFPDYLIEVEEVFEKGDTIALFGFASGTYKGKKTPDNACYWRLPAVWRVVVVDGKVKVWQVYCDSKIPYEVMEK